MTETSQLVFGSPDGPRFWSLGSSKQGRIAADDFRTRFGHFVLNPDELSDAQTEARIACFGDFEPGGEPMRQFPPMEQPWPEDMPRPLLCLPPGFWLNIFSDNGVYYFVSAQLREALALPPQAAQYLPVDYVDTPPEIRALDYRWLAWANIERDVIDWDRTEGRLDQWTNAVTGQIELQLSSGTRNIATREDFTPRFEMFRPYGNETVFCATPALEARVMAARLAGVEFREYGHHSYVTPFWLSDERGRQIFHPGR